MDQVAIIDSRSAWMIEEDNRSLCKMCRSYKYCFTRVGQDCKKYGGDRIPKIRIPQKGRNRS